MPIVWNAENESKLLAGLFKVCDIKVSGQQLKELAEMMGSDCTPKAVTHRIAKFKKAAAAFNGGSKKGRASPSEEAENGEDAGEGGKKKGAKGGKRGKKRQAEEAAGDGYEDDEEQSMKKVKAEEDAEDEYV